MLEQEIRSDTVEPGACIRARLIECPTTFERDAKRLAHQSFGDVEAHATNQETQRRFGMPIIDLREYRRVFDGRGHDLSIGWVAHDAPVGVRSCFIVPIVARSRALFDDLHGLFPDARFWFAAAAEKLRSSRGPWEHRF
jgi:hypothetical protein